MHLKISRYFASLNLNKDTFTFMHLADSFIQSDLQCIQVIHLLSVCVFPGNWTHDLYTTCSTTEPQEHLSEARTLSLYLNSTVKIHILKCQKELSSTIYLVSVNPNS